MALSALPQKIKFINRLHIFLINSRVSRVSLGLIQRPDRPPNFPSKEAPAEGCRVAAGRVPGLDVAYLCTLLTVSHPSLDTLLH